MGIPQNGWLLMEHPIKMDDLGGSPIVGNHHIPNSQQIQKRSGKMEESWYVQHLIDLPVVGKRGKVLFVLEPFILESKIQYIYICMYVCMDGWMDLM